MSAQRTDGRRLKRRTPRAQELLLTARWQTKSEVSSKARVLPLHKTVLAAHGDVGDTGHRRIAHRLLKRGAPVDVDLLPVLMSSFGARIHQW